MKTRLSILALVATTLVASVADPAGATGGSNDRVVGGARDAFDANVSVSAHSGPSGEDARGHINATLPFPGTPGDTIQIRIEITCLAVVENLAAAGGVVTESSANDVPPGTTFVVVFRDMGLPGGEGDAVAPFLGAPAEDCPAFVPFAAAAPPIRNGNVSIRDATP